MSSPLDIVNYKYYTACKVYLTRKELFVIDNRVRKLREDMGLTQAELATRTSVSRQTINAIETGKYDPSIWLAYSLSKVFSRSIEEIFIFEEGVIQDEN